MKKLFYLLIFLSGVAFAQQDEFFINPAFRTKLMSATSGSGILRNATGNPIILDTDNNTFVSFSEAVAVAQINLPSTGASLTSLEGIQYFTNLNTLLCSGNSITSLNLESLQNLVTLNCDSNNIILLNLPTQSVLNTLRCKGNSLITLDLIHQKNLAILDCSFNNLTTLDVENCILLNELSCKNNELLTLFIKNGRNEILDLNGGGNGSMVYICADESQIGTLNIPNSWNCVINSFCTDNPGGNYNTVKGNVSIDAQLPKSYVKVRCIIGSTTLETTTNAEGDYAFYTTETGAFTISLATENGALFNNNASLTGSFPGTNPFVADFNLQTTAAADYNDVEMMIAPTFPEGGLKTYLVVVKNKGNRVASGSMKIINNNVVTLVIPVDVPSAINFNIYDPFTGISDWSYDNLEPFASVNMKVSFIVPNSTTPINISNVITTTGLPDSNFIDNNFICAETSADVVTNPNTIQCIEGATVDQSLIGQYLHYMINIQNDGAGVANTIIVENTFDATKYDVGSLQILGSSLESNDLLPHPVQLDVKGNKATYSFRKAGNGGPGGQGTVLLKIKTKDNILPGSSVTNNIIVNFEYDAPIVVAGSPTTFANLQVASSQLDKSITVFPNPVTSIVNVSGKNSIQSVQVYDVQGRLLQTTLGNDTNYAIDISNKTNGVYFLKITSDKGMKVERVVKE